ncbi:MAG: hypothetical protein ACRDOY_12130 [Nocardioidaceae bacterium]
MLTTEWFEDAVRPEVVVSALAGCVPELGDGRLTVLGCRITRVRSVVAEESWTAIYEMDFREVQSGVERTFIARGTLRRPGLPLPPLAPAVPFGAAGWTCVVPELGLHLRLLPWDDALPGLARITDPEEARLLLEETLQGDEGFPDPFALDRCDPTVEALKPGIRATVICRLTYPGDRLDAPAAVVVKVHHDDEGLRGYEAMRALAESSFGSPAGVVFARALAYLPDLRLSVQEYVQHRSSLKAAFHRAFERDAAADWAELRDATRATATALALLHTCGCAYGEPVTWLEELASQRDKHHKLAAVVPSLRDDTGAELDRVAAAAERTAADPLGPCHHSFRPANVLLANSSVSFIDFDKFCQAEPASDIGHLMAKLQHMAVNKVVTPNPVTESAREARVADLRAVLLEEYERHAPVSAERVALWQALELHSLVLSAAKKANDSWNDSCHRMLERHLAMHGI